MMKMKKLATGFLAAAMMLSVSNAVFASDTISYTDCDSVTITKVYEAENEGTTSPAETFHFIARSQKKRLKKLETFISSIIFL